MKTYYYVRKNGELFSSYRIANSGGWVIFTGFTCRIEKCITDYETALQLSFENLMRVELFQLNALRQTRANIQATKKTIERIQDEDQDDLFGHDVNE